MFFYVNLTVWTIFDSSLLIYTQANYIFINSYIHVEE